MEHIKMPRGDIRNIHFIVRDANDTEVSKEFTQITFTVKANTSSRRIIIQKKLTDGTITKSGNVYSFSIMPEDTDCIDYGTYYYDIELIKGDKIHQTKSGTSLVVQAVLRDWHSRILRVHHIHQQVQFPHRLFRLL